MMKNYHRSALFGIVTLLAACATFSGCGDKCAGVYCAPCTTSPSDIVVIFDRDSLRGGFRKAEINGAYVVLYTASGFTTPIDTVRQKRGGVDFYQGYTTLGTLFQTVAPTAIQAPYPEAYNFRFVLPNANRTYDFSNIELKTESSGGCCDCGHNTRRRFVLNGVPVVADGSEYDERAAILRR